MKLEDRVGEVLQLCEHYLSEHKSVPIEVAAEIMGCGAGALRNSILADRCPFGFSSRMEGKQAGGYVIPPETLWAWYSKGVYKPDDYRKREATS